MPRARRIVFSMLAALSASGIATSFAQDGAGRAGAVEQPGPKPGPRPNAKAPRAAASPGNQIQMNALLKLWEGQSAQLKTLDVRIYRIDRTPAWKEEIHYEGRAIFQNPQLAYLDFKKIKTAPDAQGKLVAMKNPKDPKKFDTTAHETIICGKDEVWQYLYPVKQIFVYPMAKEQRQKALDEGPLPFLFNMKAAEAKARYDMTFLGANAKYYSVLVEPKLPEDKEAFKKAQIILDKEFVLPVRITLISPDNKSSKEFQLDHITPNAVVNDTWFQGRALKGWKLMRDAKAVGQARGGPAAAPGRPAAGPMPRR